MTQEVEIKFKLAGLPHLDVENKGRAIKQGYLDFKNDSEIQNIIAHTFSDIDLDAVKEARIRAKGSGEDTKYYFTLKGDGTLRRDEYEEEIAPELFHQLWPESKLGRISKTRREIDLGDGLIAEVDEYGESLEGLVSLEVEFDPEKIDLENVKTKVLTLDPTAEDVTEIKAYKNKELALFKNLGELEEAVKKESDEKMAEPHSELKRT